MQYDRPKDVPEYLAVNTSSALHSYQFFPLNSHHVRQLRRSRVGWRDSLGACVRYTRKDDAPGSARAVDEGDAHIMVRLEIFLQPLGLNRPTSALSAES